MPWKIKTVELGGTQPCIHLVDPRNKLHMETYLDVRETHIYIGSSDPDRARFYLIVDADGIDVERAEEYTLQDTHIIRNILETMGRKRKEYQDLLDPYYIQVNAQRSIAAAG